MSRRRKLAFPADIVGPHKPSGPSITLIGVEARNFQRRYNEMHACCPRCGSDDLSQTAKFFDRINPSTFKDGNRVRCNGDGCRWFGVVHQLIPKKEPRVEHLDMILPCLFGLADVINQGRFDKDLDSVTMSKFLAAAEEVMSRAGMANESVKAVLSQIASRLTSEEEGNPTFIQPCNEMLVRGGHPKEHIYNIRMPIVKTKEFVIEAFANVKFRDREDILIPEKKPTPQEAANQKALQQEIDSKIRQTEEPIKG